MEKKNEAWLRKEAASLIRELRALRKTPGRSLSLREDNRNTRSLVRTFMDDTRRMYRGWRQWENGC